MSTPWRDGNESTVAHAVGNVESIETLLNQSLQTTLLPPNVHIEGVVPIIGLKKQLDVDDTQLALRAGQLIVTVIVDAIKQYEARVCGAVIFQQLRFVLVKYTDSGVVDPDAKSTKGHAAMASAWLKSLKPSDTPDEDWSRVTKKIIELNQTLQPVIGSIRRWSAFQDMVQQFKVARPGASFHTAARRASIANTLLEANCIDDHFIQTLPDSVRPASMEIATLRLIHHLMFSTLSVKRLNEKYYADAAGQFDSVVRILLQGLMHA